MRIKIIFIIFMAFYLSVFTFSTYAADGCNESADCSSCSGRCGTQTCTYYGTFTSWNTSTETYQICLYQCWDQNMVDPNSSSIYWVPDEYPSVTCQNVCYPTTYEDAYNQSCIQETANVVCNCEPLPEDPTPTPAAGGGEVPTPTPGTYLISGTIQEDNDAGLSGNICIQATNNPLSLANLSITSGAYSANFSSIIPGFYTLNTSYTGSNYTVTLDLSNQTGLIEYICSCPAAFDPDNPYVCQYTGVDSPSDNVNFYLQVNNLSNESWFQVFGGNFFARNGIASNVPYTFCSLDANCQAALSVPLIGSSNQSSSGFPIVNADNNSAVRSYDYSSAYHSYLHLDQRTNNFNSYVVSADLNQLSYDYFYKLAQGQIQAIGNGEDLEPLLSDWTNTTWWAIDAVNYIKVDGNVNIDETQGFNLTSDQQLVVFVDGNLILDDSNPNDTNRKITSVAPGGFLAFFVSGDIIITAEVGYELDPLNPSTPPVSHANSNLEGVFVAHHDLILQSKTAIGEVPPDKKFIGAGTFVGWNNVLLNRTFDDNNFGPILNNTQAIENFIYRPDLLVNWPAKLKASASHWREVAPQYIGQ